MSVEATKYNHIRTSYLMKDGTWFHVNKQNENWYYHEGGMKYIDDGKWSESHNYLYLTSSGTNQSCIATISVEEREWITDEGDRKIYKCIEVAFAGELGKEAGSWKGGVVGCNYEMLPNETPLQTLRRMELNRTF